MENGENSGSLDQSVEESSVALEAVVTHSDASPPRGNPFPIVGIGASAGGLEAFRQILAALPPSTGMAFVLVQHLDPQHPSLLPEILSSVSPMPVVGVTDGVAVEPDHVYVIPRNSSMVLEDGHLRLVNREPGLHLPIDIFFRSLAAVQGSRAVGVVLSGNASDGSLGLRAIKAECGLTFAQDEATARFGGMPHNAIATGAVDYVLPPDGIARELAAIARHPYLIPRRPGQAETEELPSGDGELMRIFSLLQLATKVDFSRYKPTTVRRRIGRRMMVLRMKSMADYVHYIEQHSTELRELYKDLLISVTSFFRDPESFHALARHLSTALSVRGPSQPVRFWVPGCATGEEVYSLAICLFEVLQDIQPSLPVQIFGTDISEVALERARQGVYPSGIAVDVSQERLRRFFIKTESGFQISKVIRECCVFARHDVTRDPPFSNLDLISCRNLLIYLDHATHRRIFPTFHYALREGGLLMLGSAETPAAAADLFDNVEKQHRIYVRKSSPTRHSFDMALLPSSSGEFPSAYEAARRAGSFDLQKKLDRLIHTRYSPDAVLVNAELQIVQFRGHTSSYLDPAPGEASLNVLRMARESLVIPLRRAVKNAAETGVTVVETNVPLDFAGRHKEITLEVTPITDSAPEEVYYFIVFQSQPPGSSVPSLSLDSLPPDERVLQLQRELVETHEYLRHLTEEYEAHAEELSAANEEARSANEELQSTNEELGTTKEELQSANEELTTLNEELHNRNQELSNTNSDLRNLLTAVDVAILMVDSDLRLRRFNPAASHLLQLAAVDIGRPIAHVRGRIEMPRLEQQVKSVLESLHATVEEVRDSEGRWFSVGVRPYRTLDDRIAGAVIILQDIDPLKRGIQAAEDARDAAEGMIETVREPLVVLDSDLRVIRATSAFYETFLVSREETEGRFLYDLGNGQWNSPRLRELLGAALYRSEPFHDFEIEHEFPHIGHRTMRLNGRRIPRADPQHRTLLLSIEDVTERREIAEIKFQRLFETAKDGIIVLDAETRSVLDVNPYFLSLTGATREDVIGKQFSAVARSLGIPEAGNVVSMASETEVVRLDDLQMKGPSGNTIGIDIVANRYTVGSQPVVQLNIRDISARKEAVRALRESEARFRLFVESVRDYALFQLDQEGCILSWNAGAQNLLGWSGEEAVGRPASLVFVPEDVAAGEHIRELETARAVGRAEDERWHIRKDGSRFFASGVLTQLHDEDGNMIGFAKIMRDVTARKEYEEQLHRSVEDKSILVREIHHRVKNNLQVIVSLLGLQARNSVDPQVVAAFTETEGRVRAIAHIHERLYASDDLTEVEFAAYLTNLTRELLALHAGPTPVDLDLQAADMVLHIEQAIPLGLIANELIVNSLKHGLRGGPGRLTVRLSYLDGTHDPDKGETLDDSWAELCVADSGPGLPDDFQLNKAGSMGLRLVTLLTRQLHARFHLGPRPGATVTVAFPLKYK